MRVTVILTDAEYAEAKRRAGLIPLSAWFRSVALGDLPKGEKRQRVAKLPPDGGVRLVEGRIDTPERDSGGIPEACSHKKRRGELCYKCDSKFGLPHISEN